MPTDLITELYAAPPDGFVAARDAAVAAAKEAGEPDTAKEIAKLRKPTVAAWVVNLLAIRRPDLVDELVELSAAMRAAQRELKGEQLRELSAQRRTAVNGLLKEAVQLAGKADPRNRSKLPVNEVESTLTAAMSDVDVAELVRSGRLTKAATYAGFGEVPRPQLRLVVDRDETAGEPDAKPNKQAAKAERAAQRRQYAKELANARTELKKAETDLDRATKAERDGAATVEDLEAQLAELERQRAAAEAELARLKLARKGAERAVTAARRRVGDVEGAVEAFDEEDA
jgi:chromosome segregation ATPase